MAGQSTMMSREEVRSKISSVECNKGGKGGKMPAKESMKTTNNK